MRPNTLRAKRGRWIINIDGSDRDGCGAVGLYNGKLLIKAGLFLFHLRPCLVALCKVFEKTSFYI